MAFTRPPVTAADASFSAAGASAWNAGYGVAGATAGGVVYCPTATTETTSSGLTFNASGAAGEGLAIAAGTAASAVSALTISGTVNYNAAALNFIDITMTDTSSHANTNALRIRGGVSGTTDLLTLSKGGAATFGGSVTAAAAGFTASSSQFVQVPSPNAYFTGSVAGDAWVGASTSSGKRVGIGDNNAGLAGIIVAGTYYEMTEATAPSAGPANSVRIYAQDNGAGKTQLMALFSSGAAQQIAIQP